MNSKPEFLKEDKKSNTCNENIHFHERCEHSSSGKIIVKCGKGGIVPTNFIFDASPTVVNRAIASVNVDATNLFCPTVIIHFTGILTGTPTLVGAFSLFSFTLYKSCKDMITRIPVAYYNFSYINIVDTSDSRTLQFDYLSHDVQCGECCTYTMELTSISNGVPGVINFSIDNAQLYALIVEGPYD